MPCEKQRSSLSAFLLRGRRRNERLSLLPARLVPRTHCRPASYAGGRVDCWLGITAAGSFRPKSTRHDTSPDTCQRVVSFYGILCFTADVGALSCDVSSGVPLPTTHTMWRCPRWRRPHARR